MKKPELSAEALDALDDARDVREPFAGSTLDALIAQARLALSLSARVATLEAELADMSDSLKTCDECGAQCSVRRGADMAKYVAELEAELADRHSLDLIAEREGAEIVSESLQWQTRANALREALDSASAFLWTAIAADAFHDWATDTERGGLDPRAEHGKLQAALAQTPAASLAAHDAEVLERAIAEITNRCVRQVGESALIPGYNRCMDDVDRAIERIRALAAQAQEVTK